MTADALSPPAAPKSPVGLPARYHQAWKAPFDREVSARIAPGVTVLDIGGGRHPALPVGDRPGGLTYIGLDMDAAEFAAAPEGAYDRTVVGDAAAWIPELAAAVDLAISWQVFEHVRSLRAVLDNTYGYLRPGGTLVSLFSGRWSVFGVVNRVLPGHVGLPIINRVGRRTVRNKPVFPAYYDDCSYSALRRITRGWSSVEIVPLFHGATYFGFAPPLMRAYLAVENGLHRMHVKDAATHYLLVAQK